MSDSLFSETIKSWNVLELLDKLESISASIEKSKYDHYMSIDTYHLLSSNKKDIENEIIKRTSIPYLKEELKKIHGIILYSHGV